MAVASCVVVVDLPVRQVFLLQAVHRIAAWLGPEACYPVLRHAFKEIRLLPHDSGSLKGGQEDPGGRARRSQEEPEGGRNSYVGGPDFGQISYFFAKSFRAGKK